MSQQAVRFLIRDRRNKGWFRVGNDIWLMEISRYAKLVYCYLCRCAEDATTCHPSFPDIRRKTGCSHGTIVKALQELEKVGLIKRTPEVGTSTTYEVFDPIVERTQSQVDRPLPSHGLTAPQSQVDYPTQSRVDRKEDLVLKKTTVKKTQQSQKQHPAPRNGAGEPDQSAVQLGGLLPEVAVAVDALEVPTPDSAARPAGPTRVSAATPGVPVATVAPVAAAPAPARRGHPAIAPYYDRWRDHHGKVPTITPKRVGILTRIYKGLGPAATEEYPRLLDALFGSTDRFLIDNAHSPEVFETKLDALRVNGHGSPLSGFSRAGRATMEAGKLWLQQTTGGGAGS